MRRRDFITLVGGSAVWPIGARAQQSMPVIGYLGSENSDRYATRLTAFRQGLGAMGFDEGRNVAIDFVWADGQPDRLPALAADLVRRRVTVIVAPGSAAAGLAAKAATTTIPVVFETGLDPVQAGLVKSLNRPEGNVTGVTSLNSAVTPKGLELLHELLPQAKRFSVLLNPANVVIADIVMKGVDASSRALGLELQILNADTERDFEPVFAKLVEPRTAGLLITANPVFNSRAHELAALTLKHAVPAVHDFDDAFATMNREPPDAILMVNDALTVLNRKRIFDFATERRFLSDPVRTTSILRREPGNCTRTSRANS